MSFVSSNFMSFSPNVLLIPNFVKNKFHSVTLFSFSQYSVDSNLKVYHP